MLAAGSPAEVLAKLTDGDPLGLVELTLDRLAELALMVDASRITALVFATVARCAPELEGDEPPEGWLQDCIDLALRDTLHEDRLDARLGIPPDDPDGDRYGFLSDSLGVDPTIAREAAVVFNDLPIHVRRAFYALVVHGKPLDQCTEEGLGDPDQIRDLVQRALEAMSTLGESEEDAP